MIWKSGHGQEHGRWQGPGRVLSQDAQQVVWVSHLGRLYRVAPEHVRPISADERPATDAESWAEIRTQLQQKGGTHRFVDLLPDSPERSRSLDSSGPSATVFDDQTGTTNPTSGTVPDGENQVAEGTAAQGSPLVSASQPDIEPPAAMSSQEPSRRSSLATEPRSMSLPANPASIPVPTDSEDELVAIEDAFALRRDSCWVCEVFITEADVSKWRAADNPEELSFLATAAKRQRAEVRMSQLSAEHRAEFDKAKACEIDSWLKTSTVERILRHKIPPENIMRCRWVLTWKDVDEAPQGTEKSSMPSSGKNQKAKARLVILGFEDPLIDQMPRDSPTLSRDARMLALQFIASRRWEVGAFDVKTAFLRGRVQSDRILGLEPPAELRERLKLRDEEICRLLKGAYGLVNAPYLWYQELSTALHDLGFVKSRLDPCLFLLVDPTTKCVSGVIGIHVDDGLWGQCLLPGTTCKAREEISVRCSPN